MPKLCSFGCQPEGQTMHCFPNPNKYPDRFRLWVSVVGGKLETASDYDYFKKKMVCDKHFTDNDRNRCRRLNALAVPSLYLTESLLEISSTLDVMTEHNYSVFSRPKKNILVEDTTEMSESESGLLTAKYKLLELFASLDDSELDSIEQWICSKSYKKDLEQKISLLKKENMLVKISKTLKKVLPFEAEMPSENIVPPTVGSQADCNEYNTCHIDEFLYDEDDVDKLVETGKVKRHYCLDCHSRNTKALTYISHSMSRQAVQYIFTVLLPKDLEDKQVLDVGSRIGAVLYGAYYFSNAGTIIGIEMNKECCDIQDRIISEYSIDNNRMKIVHSDVMDRSDIVSNSDIVVINNPDFFIDVEKHKNMWYFFKKHVKKGSYLVSSRSVTDTLESLGIFDDLIDWLSICKPNQQDNEILFDIEDYSEIFLYAVN